MGCQHGEGTRGALVQSLTCALGAWAVDGAAMKHSGSYCGKPRARNQCLQRSGRGCESGCLRYQAGLEGPGMGGIRAQASSQYATD